MYGRSGSNVKCGGSCKLGGGDGFAGVVAFVTTTATVWEVAPRNVGAFVTAKASSSVGTASSSNVVSSTTSAGTGRLPSARPGGGTVWWGGIVNRYDISTRVSDSEIIRAATMSHVAALRSRLGPTAGGTAPTAALRRVREDEKAGKSRMAVEGEPPGGGGAGSATQTRASPPAWLESQSLGRRLTHRCVACNAQGGDNPFVRANDLGESTDGVTLLASPNPCVRGPGPWSGVQKKKREERDRDWGRSGDGRWATSISQRGPTIDRDLVPTQRQS